MNEDIYLEQLNIVKQNEKPEVVLLIAENPELIKIIIAWTNLEVRKSDTLTALPGDSDNEILEWLWENTRYSITELKIYAGISYAEEILKRRMKLLRGNRIIYPDGTVNSFVQRFLRERVLKLFTTKPDKTIRK